MDPYEALIGTDILEDEQRRGLAKALRQKAVGGAGLATSGLGEIANQGRLLQTLANQQAQNIGYQQRAAEGELTDRMRPDYSDESLGFAKPSNTATQKFEEQAANIGQVKSLVNRFRDDYAGSVYLLGDVENWVARKSKGKFGDEAQAEWWSDFKDMYENIRRNELFGSALTAQEKAEWRKANVNPDDSPELIRSKLATLDKIQNKLAAANASNALNKDWRPSYVKGVYRDVIPPEAWDDLEGYRASQNLNQTQLNQRNKAVTDYDTEQLLEELFGGN